MFGNRKDKSLKLKSNENLCNLLHAYEVKVLSDSDIERFEAHMLICDSCFDSVKGFKAYSDVMTNSDLIKETVLEWDSSESMPGSFFAKLWRYLWPQAPVVFRPAFSYVLLLSVLIPVGLRVLGVNGDSIKTAQYQDLISARSASKVMLKKSLGDQAFLTFYYQSAVPDKDYLLTIRFEDGEVIYEDANFNTFNDYQTGGINLNIGRLKSGRYNLSIEDTNKLPAEDKVYTFWIE